jgi:hypothetical protein
VTVVRAAAVGTLVRSALRLREWEMGGGDECGEEERAPRPFIGSEGERGGRTGKGIRRPVVAASMPAIRFSGEGKQRAEWGVKRGENAAPFLGEEGSSGRWQRAWEVAAAVSGGRRQSDG